MTEKKKVVKGQGVVNEKKAPEKKQPKSEAAPAMKQPIKYVAAVPHTTNAIIRSCDKSWRARGMTVEGHYIWRIPAEEVEQFERHHAFVQGHVKRSESASG